MHDRTPEYICSLVTALALCLLVPAFVSADNGKYRMSPHGSQTTGVLRTMDFSRGSCAQCHTTHSSTQVVPFGLFQENSNELCMSQSMGGCHADQPTGSSSGYPAQEIDRLPLGSSDPGYFEHNSGGVRIAGLNNLVRWPGRVVWQSATFSPHNSDPDMPIRDLFGNGSCDNCHDAHSGVSARDMLDTSYSGIVGSQNALRPDNFQLCFNCHSISGPLGMSDSSKRIADYYDRSINPDERAGHGISSGAGYVPNGARLPCYDCHNPHGSQGYANQGPNAFLLSDERPGWYGLTNIRNDNDQVRRFCFGCHVSSDNLGGGTVEGIMLSPLESVVPAHAFADSTHCYDCHGRDYSSPTGFNVHHPADGESQVGALPVQPSKSPEADRSGWRRFK